MIQALMLMAALAQDQERARELEKLQWLQERIVPPEVEEGWFVDYGIWFRPQYYAFRDGAGQRRSRQEHDARPWLDLRYGGTHSLYLRGRERYEAWARGDSPVGEQREEDFDLDVGFYQLDLSRRTESGAAEPLGYLRLGRSYHKLGSGLTFNGLLDGAMAGWTLGPVRVTGLYGKTITDTDDLDQSRPNPAESRRWFAMATLEVPLGSDWVPYFLGVTERDRNRESPHDPVQDYEWDAEYWGMGIRGVPAEGMTVLLEYVVNRGERFADLATVVPEDIDAWAAVLEGVWFIGDSRLEAALYVSSGDRDRLFAANTHLGNTQGTDDTAFVAFGFIPAGLVLNPLLTNIKVHKIGAFTRLIRPGGLFDAEDLEMGLEVFWFSKEDAGAVSDPFMDLSERKIGWEADLTADYALFSDLSFTVRGGYFLPSEAPLFRGGRFFFLFSLVYSY